MYLPELEGTDKQVNWANSIRRDYIHGMSEQQVKDNDTVQDQTYASWWIANKDIAETKKEWKANDELFDTKAPTSFTGADAALISDIDHIIDEQKLIKADIKKILAHLERIFT